MGLHHSVEKWLFWGLYLLLFPLSIPVGIASAIASGKLIRWRIYGHEETVGVITRIGFPIWFSETAPGYANLFGGIKYDRLEWNILFWIVFWGLVIVVVPIVRRRLHQTSPNLPRGIGTCLRVFQILFSVYLGYVFSLATGWSLLLMGDFLYVEPFPVTHLGFPVWYLHFSPDVPDGISRCMWCESLNAVFWTLFWLAVFFRKRLKDGILHNTCALFSRRS